MNRCKRDGMAWKPKIFIIWPSTEKIGWPLLYKKPFQIFLIDYNIDDIKKKTNTNK